jgi:hypothetical protein
MFLREFEIYRRVQEATLRHLRYKDLSTLLDQCNLHRSARFTAAKPPRTIYGLHLREWMLGFCMVEDRIEASQITNQYCYHIFLMEEFKANLLQ